MRHPQDIHHNIEQRLGLTPQTITTGTVNGEIIDTREYEALEFILISGTITDGTYTVSLQHGAAADLSDAVAVPATLVLGNANFAATDDNTVKRIGYIGKERYVRLSIVAAGAGTGGAFSGAAVLGSPWHMPVPD